MQNKFFLQQRHPEDAPRAASGSRGFTGALFMARDPENSARSVFRMTLAAGLFLLSTSLAFAAQPPDPVRAYPDLDYINVTQALLKLGKLKPDNDDYLDAYAMAVHCDIVQGNYRDEFRWKQARVAMKKYISEKAGHLPTRLAVRSQILFQRYDFSTKYFLFSPETQLTKINTFTTNNRPNNPGCNAEPLKLLPSSYQVVTNNPVNLPGIRMSEDQAHDLSQKFASQNNQRRLAYVRFVVDLTGTDSAIGPSLFAGNKLGDQRIRIKGALYAIEFFSDPEYQNRFYIYYPY